MTLPYIWYRASVWILLCEAVNNFWGFLVIFWKVPVIMELAACSAKLEPPLWRPLSSFPLATWRWIIFEHVFFFFFFPHGWLYMSDGNQVADDFSVRLTFFYSFLFSPRLCHSTVTGTYLWDICRKVGISMWKGSCRQCYALCIHSICMKCSRCHSCKPVIHWQYFRQSTENNLKKTHRLLLYRL